MKKNELIDFVMKSKKTEIIESGEDIEYNYYLPNNIWQGGKEVFSASVYIFDNAKTEFWFKAFVENDNIDYIAFEDLDADTLQKVLEQCK